MFTPEGLQETEAENFRIGLAALGETYGLVENALGLYDRLGHSVGESGIRLSAATVATLAFLHGCRYALVKGVLELLRGHQMIPTCEVTNRPRREGDGESLKIAPAPSSTRPGSSSSASQSSSAELRRFGSIQLRRLKLGF
jgi:hypothetical protein